MIDTKAHLNLKDNVVPKFMKPYPVAYDKRHAVEAEIERMLKNGSYRTSLFQ